MSNQIYLTKLEFIVVKTLIHPNSKQNQWSDLVYQNPFQSLEHINLYLSKHEFGFVKTRNQIKSKM